MKKEYFYVCTSGHDFNDNYQYYKRIIGERIKFTGCPDTFFVHKKLQCKNWYSVSEIQTGLCACYLGGRTKKEAIKDAEKIINLHKKYINLKIEQELFLRRGEPCRNKN